MIKMKPIYLVIPLGFNEQVKIDDIIILDDEDEAKKFVDELNKLCNPIGLRLWIVRNIYLNSCCQEALDTNTEMILRNQGK